MLLVPLLATLLASPAAPPASPPPSVDERLRALCRESVTGLPEKLLLERLGPPRSSERTQRPWPWGSVSHRWESRDGTLSLDIQFTKGRSVSASSAGCPPPVGVEDALRVLRAGDVEGLRRLLDQGLRVDLSGGRFDESLLGNAILLGQPQAAALLVQRGADVRWPGSPLPPLLRAASICDLASTRLLVEHGAPLEFQRPGQPAESVLTAAIAPGALARGDCHPVVAYLLEHRANPDAVDPELHHPALILAVLRNDPRQVEALLRAGADPNVRSSGRAALAYAVEAFPREPPAAADSFRIIELLVKSGARTNARARDDQTLAQLARQRFPRTSDAAGAQYRERVLRLLSPPAAGAAIP